MIICQDLLCNKKLISSGSISVSVFLLTNFAYYVCCVHPELILFRKQDNVQLHVVKVHLTQTSKILFLHKDDVQ